MIHDAIPPRRAGKSMFGQVTVAMRDVLAERLRQISKFGHNADADDRLPRCHLLKQAHVRLLDASDLVSGNARDDELQRARRKAVQAAALCLAEIERIDRQLNHEGNRNDG